MTRTVSEELPLLQSICRKYDSDEGEQAVEATFVRSNVSKCNVFYCNRVGSRVMLWPFGDVFTSSFLCIGKAMQGAQNVLRTLVGRGFLDVTFHATLRCQSAFQVVRSGWFFYQCDAPLGFPFMNEFCK